MSRRYVDSLTHNEECVEYGKKELGYDRVLHEEVNYMEKELDVDRERVNIAKGGNLKRNKKIVRNKDVDILLDPVEPEKKAFDTATATVAEENEVAVGITLKKILSYSGMKKVKHLGALEYLGKLVRRKGCTFVITSGAEEKLDMRAPMDLASVGYIAGFNKEESLKAVSENIHGIIGDEDA